MLRVKQVKARKDYPEQGIKRGDVYFNWKFNFDSHVHRSLTRPKQSQLTKSDFLGQVYDFQGRIDALSSDSCISDVRLEVESLAEEIRALGEEQEEKRDNMPENLQESPTAELLQDRVNSCEEWADELEGVDLDEAEEKEEGFGEQEEKGFKNDDEEEESREEMEGAKEDALNELQGCTYNGE